VKLTTVVNFINILQAVFAPILFCQKITNPNCITREKLSKALSYQKGAGKMLMKLTTGHQRSHFAAPSQSDSTVLPLCSPTKVN